MRLLVVLGFALLGVAGIIGTRVGRLQDRMRGVQVHSMRLPLSVALSSAQYRPDGWQMLNQLRWMLSLLCVVAFAAICLFLYACPKV